MKSRRILLLTLCWFLLGSSALSADLTLSYGTPEQVGMSADVLKAGRAGVSISHNQGRTSIIELRQGAGGLRQFRPAGVGGASREARGSQVIAALRRRPALPRP